MQKRLKTAIKEMIIGFGFLNGIWFSIGIDPEKVVMNLLSRYEMTLPAAFHWLFVIMPLVLMIITFFTLIRIYKKGGILGSVAVLVGFVSGTLLIIDWAISLIILAIAVSLGMIGFKKSKKR